MNTGLRPSFHRGHLCGSMNFDLPFRGLFFVFLSNAAISFAQLGETSEQLEKRFGKPISQSPAVVTVQGKTVVFGDSRDFVSDGWRLAAVVTEGVCTQIAYRRAGEWPEDRFEKLLQQNRQGWVWEEVSVKRRPAYVRKWRRSDDTEAVWTMALTSLVITTPAHKAAQQKALNPVKSGNP